MTSVLFPKRATPARKPEIQRRSASEEVLKIARASAPESLERLGTNLTGLSSDEAEQRLERDGPNTIAKDEGQSRLGIFAKAAVNPLVLLLAVLATVSFATGDARAAIVMLVMVALGVSLRFVQETRANSAAKALRAMIKVTATVLRDGTPRELPL